jgi:hypothetical protein
MPAIDFTSMTLGFAVPTFSPADADPCFCRSGQLFGACCGARSERRKPPAGIRVLPGFVDPATCRKWVERLCASPAIAPASWMPSAPRRERRYTWRTPHGSAMTSNRACCARPSMTALPRASGWRHRSWAAAWRGSKPRASCATRREAAIFDMRVEVVQAGVRYAIASWAAFSGSRRVRARA